MLKWISSLYVLFVMVSCAETEVEPAQVSAPAEEPLFDVKSHISETMQAQEDAWNNGDIEGFMHGYWQSDSLMFIGSRGLNYGWQTTLDNYIASYPGPEAMGRLKFTNLYVEPIDFQTAFVVGKWQLFRVSDTLEGHYSLTWKEKAGEWVIIADHSS